MFSLQDLERVTSTPTEVPILELFRQAVNTTGACVLETLIVLTGIGCVIACQTWQSRICWSFARDGGLPGHGWLKRVDPKLDVPLNAHLLSSAVVGLIGLLYLGSTAAFNASVLPPGEKTTH
jgi:choline transport protein